jgi:very-short-patch-repair endonuclease
MHVEATGPSPLAGEGLGRGDRVASATHKTLADILDKKRWLLDRARHMRANPTDAERALWHLLRAKRLAEHKWRRQQIIDDLYIFDFICHDLRLIVEADGSQHSDSKDDATRDAYLKGQGFVVLRFWNNDILSNLEGVGTAVLNALQSSGAQTCAAPSPQPSPVKGEGVQKAIS